MKKLKKEINKILKVFLALGLLFNNLMPLSVVFADELENSENPPAIQITDGEDDKEEKPAIDTEGEKEGEDSSCEGEETTQAEPTTEDAVSEATLIYEVYVDDAKFEDEYGWVELDKSASKVDIVVKLSGAEATEDYKFVFEGTEYTTEDLLNGVIVKSLTFEGYLYGGFELIVEGTLTDPEGNNTPYSMDYYIEHGTDEDNDEALSTVNEGYVFDHYVLTSTNYVEEELIAIVASVFPKATVEINEEGLFLSDDHGTNVWYGIVTKGDVNGDGKINQDDLDLLINQILGLEETTENSDVNGDGEVNDLDAAYLKLMLETGYTEDITSEDVTINTKFGEFSNPVKVGDEFTLEYIVTLNEYTINGISGLIGYDKNLLELTSAKAQVFNQGDMNEGHFIYLGDYLDLDIEPMEDENGDIMRDEDGRAILIFTDTDYVVLTLTFKALAEGTTTVSVDEVKYYDFDVYYTADGETSIDVTIEGEEEKSPFSSITVAGYDVDLSTYELTLPNDVTAVDLEYVLADDKYDVDSVAIPEELAEGENTIVITLVDENGEKKTYTIKVTREAKEEEKQEEAAVTPMAYDEPTYDDDDNDNDEKVAPVPTDDEEAESADEDNGKLSRVIIIILILLAIAGLIYLIFKDDKDDEETKKANRDIDKIKKEDDKKRKLEDDKKVKKKGR